MGYFQFATLIIIFLMGIVLAVLSSIIDAESLKCANKDLQNANKGVLVLAVLAMTLPITYVLCNWKCNLDIEGPMNIYALFFLALGITLIGLGSTISMNSDNCPNATGPATGVWCIGTIFVIITLAYFSIKIFKKFKNKPPAKPPRR